jgi:hypothetical protein
MGMSDIIADIARGIIDSASLKLNFNIHRHIVVIDDKLLGLP